MHIWPPSVRRDKVRTVMQTPLKCFTFPHRLNNRTAIVFPDLPYGRLVELGLCTPQNEEDETTGGLSCRVTKLQMPALDEVAGAVDGNESNEEEADREDEN